MTAARLSVNDLYPRNKIETSRSAGYPMRSIQERCGINTTFPGITEYMKRYNAKRPAEKLTAFNINPTPDSSIYGRPTARVSHTGNISSIAVQHRSIYSTSFVNALSTASEIMADISTRNHCIWFLGGVLAKFHRVSDEIRVATVQ